MLRFVEEITKAVRQEIDGIHTAVPAEVISFNADTCRATVLPKAKITLEDKRVIDYPILNDVPVCFPFMQSNDTAIAFPIKAGDSCLVVFCEQALDTWLEDGDTSSEIRFSLTNAIIIPGLIKTPSSLCKEAVKDNAIVIKNGTAKIVLKNGVTEISGSVSIDGDLTVAGKIKNQGE